MALLLAPPPAAATTLPRPRREHAPTRTRPRRAALVAPSIALATALSATGFLAWGVAAADGGPVTDSAAGSVDVGLTGALDTVGLAAGRQTASALTVSNAGARPLRWTLVPQVTGTPAVASQLDVTSRLGPCPSPDGRAPATPDGADVLPGGVLPAGVLAPAPLAPGTSAPVCVLLRLPAEAAALAGTVDVTVDVRATPA